MDMVTRLDDMSGGELLDHVGDLAATQRRCEVEIFRAALQHAYLHDPDTLDPVEAAKPGRETARRRGGEGTPLVTDFAAAELGARLGMSMYSAWALMADALDVCHRFPRLWARVEAGEVRVYLARLVARKTRGLRLEQAAVVDARVATYADGRLPYSRFEAMVDGLVAAADPDATAEAERRAAEQQWARPTRRDPATDHGMWGFYIKAPTRVVLVFDAHLQRIADILKDLGDADDVDKRRVKALLIASRPDLAVDLFAAYAAWADRPEDSAGDPPPDLDAVVSTGSTDGTRCGPKPVVYWEKLLPKVVVNVHTYLPPESCPHHIDVAGAGATGIARVEGCGPVTETWVKDHLSPHAKVTVRPVLDLEGLAPVDAYEIPERHRRAVRLMTPADTFPYSTSLTPTQIDHTTPYEHGPSAVGAGQSRLGNYGPLSTPHHRLKTFGRWQVKQPFPGTYLWRDPFGAIYLVDHSGTRALRRGRAA